MGLKDLKNSLAPTGGPWNIHQPHEETPKKPTPKKLEKPKKTLKNPPQESWRIFINCQTPPNGAWRILENPSAPPVSPETSISPTNTFWKKNHPKKPEGFQFLSPTQWAWRIWKNPFRPTREPWNINQPHEHIPKKPISKGLQDLFQFVSSTQLKHPSAPTKRLWRNPPLKAWKIFINFLASLQGPSKNH